MSKVIKCKLDTNSIQQAKDELKTYKDNLDNKLIEFVTLLFQDGMAEAKSRLATTQGDSTNASVGGVVPVKTGNKVVATIYLVGKDALFVEFGAGIHYNNGNAHPKAAELGYGVGTYPDQKYAINPGYWYWYEGKGKSKVAHFSLGTEASMPIYYASETIRNNAVARAAEVFRS